MFIGLHVSDGAVISNAENLRQLGGNHRASLGALQYNLSDGPSFVVHLEVGDFVAFGPVAANPLRHLSMMRDGVMSGRAAVRRGRAVFAHQLECAARGMSVLADGVGEDRDAPISMLIDLVEALTRKLRRLDDRVNELVATPRADANGEDDQAEQAPWVWFSSPAAAEDEPGGETDPRNTVENFVAWYNVTFVGVDGSRARSIPSCWSTHPGLTVEVAALAYSWRAANIGAAATERDAQQWLHQWRPGFADRLVRDWLSLDCLDGDHRDDRLAEPGRHGRL